MTMKACLSETNHLFTFFYFSLSHVFVNHELTVYMNFVLRFMHLWPATGLMRTDHRICRQSEASRDGVHGLLGMHVKTGKQSSRADLHFSIAAFDISLATVSVLWLLASNS